MKRRQLLAVGASAFTVAVAGCTGDDSDGAPTTDEDSGGGLYGGGGDGSTDTTTTETATTTGTAATATTTSDDGGDASVVTVGAGGQTRFDPETVTVAAGETVRWEWAASGHNVRPDSQPTDADWSGTPGGEGETYDEGYTYEFTFEVPGRYEYYCAPHQSFGMVGTVVVEA